MKKERYAIKKALPEAVEVYGSLDLEKREERIISFSDGEIKYLATKPVISGSGCNFQRHCHKAIFLGIRTVRENGRGEAGRGKAWQGKAGLGMAWKFWVEAQRIPDHSGLGVKITK